MLPLRLCSRVPARLVSLAERPPGRTDLARRRAITLQVGSHKDVSGTRSVPLFPITAGQAARNGLCRPPGVGRPAASLPRPLRALAMDERVRLDQMRRAV